MIAQNIKLIPMTIHEIFRVINIVPNVPLLVWAFMLYPKALAVVNLRGAGASFPSEVYAAYMPIYKSTRSAFVTLNMTYDVVGSGNGQKRIKKTGHDSTLDVEYAGSDGLLGEDDYLSYPDLQMLPVLAGSVVLAYNLPGIDSLVLSREHVTGIYNGTYTMWNDGSIQSLNQEKALPSKSIIVIARADSSGTTEIFTQALSSFSPNWALNPGVFKQGIGDDDLPISWNNSVVKLYGHTNRGTSGLVLSFKYSVAYISLSDALTSNLQYARIKNKAGTIVSASTESIQNAMDAKVDEFDERLTTSLTDAGGLNSYPIAGYTYLIVFKTSLNCNSAVELVRYIRWIYTSKVASSEAEIRGMAVASENVDKLVTERVLKTMTCGLDARNVWDVVQDEIQNEELAMQTWRIPLFICVPIVVIVFGTLVIYIARQQYKLNQALWKEEWKISSSNLNILTPQSQNDNWGSRMSIIKSIAASIGSSVKRGWSNGSRSNCSRDMTIRFLLNSQKLARWNDKIVNLRPVRIQLQQLKNPSKKLLITFKHFVHHVNVVKFYGVSEVKDHMYFITEYCHKAQLRDVLQNEKYVLDNNFKFSMSADIAAGMAYLHGLDIIHHSLRSSCCYIDNRWNVKIGEWQYYKLSLSQNDPYAKALPEECDCIESSQESTKHVNETYARYLLWTAPEIVSSIEAASEVTYTKENDVYSYGILIQEIFTREDPYIEATEIRPASQVLHEIVHEGLRPKFTTDTSGGLISIMESCWTSNQAERPPFGKILKKITQVNPSKKSVIDCMMETLESYVADLESKVEERTEELAVAMSNVQTLLHKILPPSVATKLSKGEAVEPEYSDACTIFFSDIVGFTNLSSESKPLEIVTMLNQLYSTFDGIIDNYDVYKVETIGDAYVVISGLPNRNEERHVGEIATMALDFAVASADFVIPHFPDRALMLRIGIHSGPVVAGVVGQKMPRYCLFGDTVNTASRMESTSVPRKIQISESTNRLLHQLGGYITAKRGQIHIKGKGEMETFWLTGKLFYDKTVPPEFLREVSDAN
ncbi:unnamed protein product [Owenia fusiformis]|uniref:Guanylate cyclase n=1 Tax=Owenia fusiformis TaxID=6347 RepID=A0A8J1UIS0_OWEFU|nr:unnamed protein product [Owenia fusiformis]